MKTLLTLLLLAGAALAQSGTGGLINASAISWSADMDKTTVKERGIKLHGQKWKVKYEGEVVLHLIRPSNLPCRTVSLPSQNISDSRC